MKLNTMVAAILLLSITTGNAVAQNRVHNQYPCAECVVYDNNGNDLRSFVKSNKNSVTARGNKVNEYSNNTWGYLQIKNAKVPSMDKDGNLNYYETIDATLALYKTADGVKATWMAREANEPKGALVYTRTNDEGKLDVDNVQYTKIMDELELKKCTIVEYYSDTYNVNDYDNLLKNYILVKNDVIKDPSGYKAVIDFYDNFFSKFTYFSDPMLEPKLFVTFFSANGVKYIGTFNVVNDKLAGKLEVCHVQYEQEKTELVAGIFKQLKGSEVYIYGEETFGLNGAIAKYARENAVMLKYTKTTTTKKFNDDK